MRRDAERMQALTLVWFLSWISYSVCLSPPGRPRLTRCRSPEKETFTCWWEPGSSGGLPISHHLYYRKESSVEVFECPDYHTAGNNSCYFNKQHTSIWIIYNITVVASNALGKTYSESVEVDVMDIVQPHPPEKVNVSVIESENNFYILVRWEPPRDADTRSGWVTIKYEIQIKMENSKEKNISWESYSAGKQLEFSIYSPQPGASYLIQVRCKLDQGLWSEWSPSALISIPDEPSHIQNAVMIFAVSLTAFIFSLTAGVLAVKMKHVKRFLLPPVPEPKINGLDTKLLKNGKSDEIFSALIVQGYPQIARNPERQVEFLVISDGDEEFDEEYKTARTFPQNCEQIVPDSTEDGTQSERLSHGPGRDGRFEFISDQRRSSKSQANIRVKLSDGITCDGTPWAEPTGYVEVDQEKQDQEDYSKISDIINDNVLVLHKDTSPVQRHKCDKTETGDVERLGYLGTATHV